MILMSVIICINAFTYHSIKLSCFVVKKNRQLKEYYY